MEYIHLWDQEIKRYVRIKHFFKKREYSTIAFAFDTITAQEKSDIKITAEMTNALAKHVPNEVLLQKEINTKNPTSLCAVLLFADVSGFTSLTEKYSMQGIQGICKLTDELNEYIGSMVQLIYENGGDVLKFAGDAFLALWKVDKFSYISDVIKKVIVCAFFIQDRMGTYQTAVGILLRVKLAIAAGNATFSVIGNETTRHFLLAGDPIENIKYAEKQCISGEVVLSPDVWSVLSSMDYQYAFKPDKKHVRVIRIKYPQKSQNETNISMCHIFLDALKRFFIKSKKQEDNVKLQFIPVFEKLRNIKLDTDQEKIGNELQLFVTQPVAAEIRAGFALDCLTEMRTTTILFVHIIPEKNILSCSENLIRMVDQAYDIIQKILLRTNGCLQKITLFDKDVSIIVVFGLRVGLPGQHRTVAKTLNCGYKIINECKTINGVVTCSIGVTTGLTYCGVVGHSLRQEYTVIGAPVNKAARFMCAYPNKVSCDEATVKKSELGIGEFVEQEEILLKGFGKPEPAYQYSPLEKLKPNTANEPDDQGPSTTKSNDDHVDQN